MNHGGHGVHGGGAEGNRDDATGATEMRTISIPDSCCPGVHPAALEKRVRVRVQTDEAKASGRVTCCCITNVPLHRAYKCLYCGEWYCTACAEEHFGISREEWTKQRDAGVSRETIAWHKVTEQMPDSDVTVLLFAPDLDEPVLMGFHDGEEWRAADDSRVGATVMAWADLPGGPEDV